MKQKPFKNKNKKLREGEINHRTATLPPGRKIHAAFKNKLRKCKTIP